MSLDTEQALKQAVLALYSADANQQAQANTWLNAFQQRHEAWQVSFSLIAADQPQEMLFFAVTLLVRKVKADWGKLDAQTKQELHRAVRLKFEQVLSWPMVPPLVLRQMCLLLAAVAGSSGGEGASELVGSTKAMLASPTGAQLGLELLTALAEECEDLDRVRRLALVNVLLPRLREVLGWVGSLLSQALEQLQGGGAQLAAAALKCTEAWLSLSQVAGGGSVLTPGELLDQQPQLFACLLGTLSGGGAPVGVAGGAVQVLLLLFGCDTYMGGNEAAERAATAQTLDALVALRHRLGGPPGEGVAVAVAQLGSALAERSPEWCCGELQQAVPLSEVMLECLSRPDPAIAESSMDYFLMINTVPLAERPPQLGPPLYDAMLRALLCHITLPPHFTTWDEEGEVDHDTFCRLRDVMLPESLETAYGLLRAEYLRYAWQLLQAAPSWQQAEAALYLFQAVSMSVKARALSGGSTANGAPPPAGSAREDAQHTQQLLSLLFQQLCGGQGVGGGHPLLARGACQLLDSYAAWFGRGKDTPLLEALHLCLEAMTCSESAPAAAKAFQSLCLRCSWRLRDPPLVSSLLEAAAPLLQPQHAQQSALSTGDKQAAVEGLARLVAGLPPPHLQEAAARLTRPAVLHAAALMQAQAQAGAAGGAGASDPGGTLGSAAVSGSMPSAQARKGLAEDLQLVASALQFLAFGTALGEGGGGGDDGGAAVVQPVVRILEEVAEVLKAVLRFACWHGDEAVAGAAAEVYRRAICSARKQGAVLLPSVMPALVSLFESTAAPGCLDVLGDIVEIHFQEGAHVLQALTQALGAACATAFPRLQANLREQPPLAAALLSLADQFAVFAPALLLPSQLLPPLLQLAAACAGLRESDPVSQALSLLSHVLAAHKQQGDQELTPEQHQVNTNAVGAVLAAHGEEVLRALVVAECDTCPRHLMRSAADCMYKLLTHPVVGNSAKGWLSGVLASGQLPGVASGQLTAEDCSMFCGIALGGSVRFARFAALVVDFGLLARGQNTSDVLLAYQM